MEPLTFLTPREKLVLNQIRGNAYLYIFGLAEEFILPLVLDHARPSLQEDDYQTRAFLKFAGAQAKQFMTVQLKANRWTYLGSGMTHPHFLDTVERLLPAARQQVEAMAPMFC